MATLRWVVAVVCTWIFAPLLRADGLVLTSQNAGQYSYGLQLDPNHGFVFAAGRQITLTGLAGVTGATVAPSLAFVVAAPTTTANSVTLTISGTIVLDPVATGTIVPLFSLTSSVLTTGNARYQVQTGTGSLSGFIPGPVEPVSGGPDLIVWRPANGTWYELPANAPVRTFQWGLPGDIPAAGDFDGDGVRDYAVWRPAQGNWFIVLSATGSTVVRQWGLPGDIPVPADYDGDGITDYAVWRPANGTWYVLPGNGSLIPTIMQWGLPGDIPVAADFDGDGKADLAVWRPAQGNWYIKLSGSGTTLLRQWGLPGDIPVAADFDGDGKADLAVWREAEGKWYILPSSTGVPYVVSQGLPGDIPVARDYDGDGKADPAVWRPSDGTWYIQRSGATLVIPWGLSGDVPVYEPAGLYKPSM